MDWRLITVYTQGQRRVNTEFKPKHKVYFFKTKKSLMSSFGCFHQPEKEGRESLSTLRGKPGCVAFL